MNTSSTVTLLELTNRVLLNAGEQPARTTSETVAAKRASQQVKRAITDILLLGSWAFMRELITPTSYDNVTRTASYERALQVEDVWYGDKLLQNVSWQDGANQTVTDGQPTQWMQVNFRQLRLSPWPATVEDQAKVLITAYVTPTVMQADTDTPGLPEVFIDALVSRATGAFLIRHLADPALGNQFNNEFEVSIQQLRDIDRGVPRRVGNMLNRVRTR
jgi:hypothetical protein